MEFVFSFVLVNYFAQFSIKDFSSTFSHVTYVTELQKGFLAKNRTADHVLTLRTLIDKYLNCHKTKVYACFVHFRKAFDLLWHDGLFSLRSGRFEVVGQEINGRARGRHARRKIALTCLLRAPVLSFAHYFQAPATQALDSYTRCYK